MFNARKIAAQIKRNVARYSSGMLSYEQFGIEQRKAWGLVAQGEMNIVGSPCMHRHCAVQRLLGFPQ